MFKHFERVPKKERERKRENIFIGKNALLSSCLAKVYASMCFFSSSSSTVSDISELIIDPALIVLTRRKLSLSKRFVLERSVNVDFQTENNCGYRMYSNGFNI